MRRIAKWVRCIDSQHGPDRKTERTEIIGLGKQSLIFYCEESKGNIIVLFSQGEYMNQPVDECVKVYEIIVEDDWIRIRVRPNSVVNSDLILSILQELYSLEAYRSEKIAGFGIFGDARVISTMKNCKKSLVISPFIMIQAGAIHIQPS